MKYLFLLLFVSENASALDGRASSAGSSAAPAPVISKRPKTISYEASTEVYYGAAGRGPIESTSYLRAIYNFDSTSSAYVSPNYLIDLDIDSDGKNNKSELGDVELGFKKKDLANLGEDRNLEGFLRLFLPTGKEQISAGTQGKFHGRLIAKHKVNRAITAGVQSRFTWYNQTRNGQLSAKGKFKTNKSWVAFNFPFVTTKLTKNISVTLLSGWERLQMRPASSSNKVNSDIWVTDFSVWSDISEDLTFILGSENEAQLGVKSREPSAFAADETKYYARVKMKM